MGDWRLDQSKATRRYIWQETRGKKDPTLQDFLKRMIPFEEYKPLRFEKIGSEIHGWRGITDTKGKVYWASCLRFVDEGWDMWSLWYRPDERRWRRTPYQELPRGRAIEGGATFLKDFLVR